MKQGNQQEIYVRILDYSKAFDGVNHELMSKVLEKMGIPTHLIVLIKMLYMNQEAMVRISAGETEWFTLHKGVRQGCILSPRLFNMYTEYIMRAAEIDELNIGIRIGGRRISNLRYADDTTIIAENEQDLKKLVNKIADKSNEAGLKLNLKKTTFMTTGEANSIVIRGEEIKMVDKVNYLGVTIKRNGNITEEIKRRIVLGKIATQKLQKFINDAGISLRTKKQLIETMIYPIVLYGCESWTTRVADKRKLDSLEMWLWR